MDLLDQLQIQIFRICDSCDSLGKDLKKVHLPGAVIAVIILVQVHTEVHWSLLFAKTISMVRFPPSSIFVSVSINIKTRRR